LDDSPNVKQRMVTINPKDLIGRTFQMDSKEDGQRFIARVVCAVVDKEEELKKRLENMKFICMVPNSTVDEILTYNDFLDQIKRDNNNIDNDTEQLYKFHHITAHQGPLWTADKD
jgi:hypothetical protein